MFHFLVDTYEHIPSSTYFSTKLDGIVIIRRTLDDFWGIFQSNDKLTFYPDKIKVEINGNRHEYSYYHIQKWVIEDTMDKFTIVINQDVLFEIRCDNPSIIKEIYETLESYVKNILDTYTV